MDSLSSSTIWTQCEGKSKRRSLDFQAWRIVEDQSKIATRKLVDSDTEQQRLEELIETAKPPLPEGPEWQSLHYLLATPFRYPPLAHGSRFRRSFEAGVWYGALSVEGGLAETAYYRMRFLGDTSAEIRSEVIFTAFSAAIRTASGIDLTSPPFHDFAAQISSKVSYAWSQPLGSAMRADGVECCQFASARDLQGGKNAAVFSPVAFAHKIVSDSSRENWYCFATRNLVEFQRQGFSGVRSVQYRRADFEVDGQLPAPSSQK